MLSVYLQAYVASALPANAQPLAFIHILFWSLQLQSDVRNLGNVWFFLTASQILVLPCEYRHTKTKQKENQTNLFFCLFESFPSVWQSSLASK